MSLVVMAGFLFFGTEAGSVPSFVVMIGYLSLVGIIYYLMYAVLSISAFYGFRIKRQQLIAGYLTGIIGVVIALQSVGELGGWDFWLLLPLAVLGYFYGSFAKGNAETKAG